MCEREKECLSVCMCVCDRKDYMCDILCVSVCMCLFVYVHPCVFVIFGSVCVCVSGKNICIMYRV